MKLILEIMQRAIFIALLHAATCTYLWASESPKDCNHSLRDVLSRLRETRGNQANELRDLLFDLMHEPTPEKKLAALPPEMRKELQEAARLDAIQRGTPNLLRSPMGQNLMHSKNSHQVFVDYLLEHESTYGTYLALREEIRAARKAGDVECVSKLTLEAIAIRQEESPHWIPPEWNQVFVSGLLFRSDWTMRGLEISVDSGVGVERLQNFLETFGKTAFEEYGFDSIRLKSQSSCLTSDLARSFQALKKIPQLRSLELFSIGLPAESVKHLVALDQLSQLSLDGVRIGNHAFEPALIVEMTHLNSFKYSRAGGYEAINYRPLLVLENLQKLHLDGPVDRDFLLAAKQMPRLHELALTGARFNNDSAAALGGFDHLTHLSLVGSLLPATAIPHIARNKRLSHLDLAGNQLQDPSLKKVQWLAPLANHPSLTHLSLDDTGVRPKDLEVFATRGNLEQLSVAGNPEIDRGSHSDLQILLQIADRPQLKELGILNRARDLLAGPLKERRKFTHATETYFENWGDEGASRTELNHPIDASALRKPTLLQERIRYYLQALPAADEPKFK